MYLYDCLMSEDGNMIMIIISYDDKKGGRCLTADCLHINNYNIQTSIYSSFFVNRVECLVMCVIQYSVLGVPAVSGTAQCDI